jgi:hypothetical protein
MAELVRQLHVPVIAKEVGSGLSESTGRRLVGAGITILDTAGADKLLGRGDMLFLPPEGAGAGHMAGWMMLLSHAAML